MACGGARYKVTASLATVEEYITRQRLAMQQCLGSVQVAHGHQPMKMPQLQLWNNSHGGPHEISHADWDYSNQGS
jgi:hypothetical protein